MVRIFWVGDAGAHTGFGRVTREIAGGLVRKYGHDISVMGLNYIGDYDPDLQGLKVYRANVAPGDDFGAQRIRTLFQKVDPEVTVVVHDPAAVWQYLYENPYDPEGSIGSRPCIAYLPIDGYDYPEDWTNLLPYAVNVVTMSEHGHRTFAPSAMVPHGINPDEFWPIAERPVKVGDVELADKVEARKFLGLDPDKFLILRVDTNSGRKDYASTLKVVGPFLERHRDATFHGHAFTDPKMPGVKIDSMLKRYDIAPGQVTMSDRLIGATTGWSQEKMNALYNAADVFITTSRGEGFGLTIAESLACGIPVIAQDCSAIPEVVGPGGILIEPERAITVPAGQDLRLANIDAFAEALESLYTNEVYRLDLGRAGRKHVTESFNGWDTAVDRFHDFIEASASRWRQSQEATTHEPG